MMRLVASVRTPEGGRLTRSAPLQCPSISVTAASITTGKTCINELASHVRALDAIGLELRAAFACIGTRDANADNEFWRRKCRELCLRPAVEPLLLAHWNKLELRDE